VKPRTVLVLAAHPDDEILGCGATIAKHCEDGDEVHVVILAEGLTSRQVSRDRSSVSNELSALEIAAREANTLLGVKSLTLHNFPDNRMDSLDRLDVIKFVEDAIQKHQPDLVYTHHAGDLNIDHRRIHEAVITACRPMPMTKTKTLLFFEIASSTEWQTSGSAPYFQPTWYVDVSSTYQLKQKALQKYQSEMRAFPHPRSLEGVEALARWRGVSCGVHYAEAFMLGRHIVRQT
jgi:LmbE family N-acetylglucosaminyl deacetylase